MVSLQRTAKWGRRQEVFLGERSENKEEKNRKSLIGWGCTVNLVWGERAQSWLGVRRLVDGIHCVSG